MIYPYRCSQCSNEFEIIKRIAEIDNKETCPKCASDRVERYIARTHFYGASDWDKAEFNPAFGQVVRNRHHRKELARRYGVEEVGNEPVENVHKHFEAERDRQHKESWERAVNDIQL